MITGNTPQNDGTQKVKEQTKKLEQTLDQKVSKIVNATLDAILANAKSRTPVSEEGSRPTYSPGALRRSGRKRKKRGETKGSVAFGGPEAPYAVYVHENLGYNVDQGHRVGEGKFLEKAVDEELPEMVQKLKHVMDDFSLSSSMSIPPEPDADDADTG